MTEYNYVRTNLKTLPTLFRRVLRKLNDYPFKQNNVVPFVVCNPTIANTFRVDRDDCHLILKGLAEAGYVRIHALRGVEVLSTELPGDDESHEGEE